jgi:ankyrin repeat protein
MSDIDEQNSDELYRVLASLHEGSDADSSLDLARRLLERGADLERPGPYCGTRLASLAFERNVRAVKFLLEAGTNPSVRSENGRTPLHAVAWWGGGSTPEPDTAAVRIIELLLEAGADVEARDDSGCTPLHEAAGGDWGNPSAVKALLARGASVDPFDTEGRTPLFLSAQRGEPPCVRLLLEAGADPLLADGSGQTALDAAREHRNSWRSICRDPPEALGFLPDDSEESALARHEEAYAEARETVELLAKVARRVRDRARRAKRRDGDIHRG